MVHSERTRSSRNGAVALDRRAIRPHPPPALRQDQLALPDQAEFALCEQTIFVLGWVVGLTVLGAWVLRYSPYAYRRGLLWRLGASLHRLLPVVELNKEFKDFFDNPPPAHRYEPPNLNRFQVAFFSGLAIAGWVLSFFLLAAIGGLTQKG